MIHRDHLLQFCAALSWHPELRSYDALRIALTLGYAVATLLTGFRAWQTRRWFWALAAACLLLLTLNKQLDLQTFVTETGRCVARYQGWYSARRGPQADLTNVVLGLLTLGIATSLILIRRNQLMTLGLLLSAALLALRILSFHNMDSLLQTRAFGLPAHGFAEAGVLLLMLYAAARRG